MRFCPKCGYEDPPYWRHHRFVSDVDYSRYEDVLTDYPFLRDMRPGEERSDAKNYYYRAKKPSSRQFIFRYPQFMGPLWYKRSHHITEHHVPRRPPIPGQSVLQAETGAAVAKTEVSA
jgi:hypothetical protein